jgi:hypothetical protein
VSDEREVIEAHRRPGEPVMSHLVPILLALVEAGNEVRWQSDYFGFLPQPHGWFCELIEPIDFELVAARFELPESIHLEPDRDRIVDDGNHADIYGGEGAKSLPGYQPPAAPQPRG